MKVGDLSSGVFEETRQHCERWGPCESDLPIDDVWPFGFSSATYDGSKTRETRQKTVEVLFRVISSEERHFVYDKVPTSCIRNVNLFNRQV